MKPYRKVEQILSQTRIGIYAVVNRPELFVDLFMETDRKGNTLFRAKWRERTENPSSYLYLSKYHSFDSEEKALGSLGLELIEIKKEWAGIF